jgi:hypothetical protein
LSDDLSYTVVFSGSTWRFRLRATLRSFRAPRLLVPLIAVTLMPIAGDRILAMLIPSPPVSRFTLYLLLLGLGGALLIVAFAALVSVLRRGPDRIVTFDLAGIHERVGDRRIEHPWSSVIELRESGHTLTIHCRTPMKSFQLSKGENARLFVVPLGTERLDAILTATIPGVKRVTSRAA